VAEGRGSSDDQPPPPVGATTATPPRTKPQRPFWREFPILVVTALALAILIKTFLVQAFYIPSSSMEPGLLVGDRILVCRICKAFSDPTYGDVIVFAGPPNEGVSDRGLVGDVLHWLGEGIGVAQPQNEDFIKRVVGLPGDVLEIDRQGRLFRNGAPVREPYLHPARDTRPFGPVTVPDGMLFVLGDNRLSSGDSRFPLPTGVGTVPVDRVIGKAFVVVWPVSRWGGIG
jgi:signal peptidase I